VVACYIRKQTGASACVCIKVKKLKDSIALNEHISEPRDVTCHMGSQSVTCHPKQVNAEQAGA